MITASHAIIYAQDAERPVPSSVTCSGGPTSMPTMAGSIFRSPPAELGVHPSGNGAGPGAGPPSGHHELYLMCDDIAATMAELTAKGVEFTTPVEDFGFGRLARLRVPGAGEIGIYQPGHPTAYDLETWAAPGRAARSPGRLPPLR